MIGAVITAVAFSGIGFALGYACHDEASRTEKPSGPAMPSREDKTARLLDAATLWIKALCEGADIEPAETVMTVKVRDKDGNGIREIHKSLAETLAEIDAHQAEVKTDGP